VFPHVSAKKDGKRLIIFALFIPPVPREGRKNRASKQKRPFSRTLTSVHDVSCCPYCPCCGVIWTLAPHHHACPCSTTQKIEQEHLISQESSINSI
jgi:hypothetical protein